MAAGDFEQRRIEKLHARWAEEAAERAKRERSARAADPKCEADSLRDLARDSDWQVRCAAASNPSLPLDVLARLVRDPWGWIRQSAAANPNLTVADVTLLAGDDDKYVRQAVVSRGTGDIPARLLRERVKCRDSWGQLTLSVDAVEFRRWGRQKEWLPLDGIEPEVTTASNGAPILALTWLSGQRRRGPGAYVGGRWEWCRPHVYGDLQIKFQVADAVDWVHAIRVNQTKSMPAPRSSLGSYEGPEPTLRQVQHQWYGAHRELNWQDRVLGETLGYPDADSYVQGFKEHDPN
ncbi:hypothetical protein [Demequina lignilytica]|uniref:hypothetical protein n=1 Tax=Demequina lignilytica TaxID=3051663 RepID=UPI00345DCEBB